MSTYKINGIHGGILPRSEVQELLVRCLRGVPTREHNQSIDKSLVELHREGNELATLELIYEYLDVFSVIMCRPAKPPRRKNMSQKVWTDPNYHDYEDLFQEIVCNFIDTINKYDPEIGSFENMARGTLHQTVFNKFFREFIVTKMTVKNVEDDSLEYFCNLIEEISNEDGNPRFDIVNKAVDKLHPMRRTILDATVFKGWSSYEVAEELKTTANNVRKTKYDALRVLRESLNYEELKQLGVVR